MKKFLIILNGVIFLIIIFWKKFMVLGMIVVGSFYYPEAAQSLKHYCFGRGDTLYVKSGYIKTSPVILNELKTMRVGEKRIVQFYQHEDWRLSYAINGFTLEKKKNKVIVKQWIEFDKGTKYYTNIKIGSITIPVYDNIAHAFNCTPFLFYYEFKQ